MKTVLIPFVLSQLICSFVSAYQGKKIGFNRDIKPILADACFHCHGGDPGSRKAELRLDTENGFFAPREDGKPTVVKGKAEESGLYLRLISQDEDEIMPPPETHKVLKPEQIALIKQWIDEGAEWQPHWSFIPLAAIDAPRTALSSNWAKNNIDHFVFSALQEQGLQPNVEASREQLARRASFDVTGLPPRDEWLQSFLKDKSEDAYEKYLDQLFKLPAYGEHRARYWLDAGRYGDTHGLHFDNYREMWPYRDWVVNAYNKNMPFDQFTIEQIAGDLLPNPTIEQLVATGFQRCNITTNEGGTIDEENAANYAADRVQTLGWVYLGLTTNCAQCHDHKFDPITAKDYYSLSAFFRNTSQKPKDGNRADGVTPFIHVPHDQDKAAYVQIKKELMDLDQKSESHKKATQAEYQQWEKQTTVDTVAKSLESDKFKTLLHLPLNEGSGNKIYAGFNQDKAFVDRGESEWEKLSFVEGGQSLRLKINSSYELPDIGNIEWNQPFSVSFWVNDLESRMNDTVLTNKDQNGVGWEITIRNRALLLSMQTTDKSTIVTKTNNIALSENNWHHVVFAYDGSGKAEGIKFYIDGIIFPTRSITQSGKPLTKKQSILSTAKTRLGRTESKSILKGVLIQDLRFHDLSLAREQVVQLQQKSNLPYILKLPREKRSVINQQTLELYYFTNFDESFKKIAKQIAVLNTKKAVIDQRSPVTHVQQENMESEPMTPILMRGAYDKLGEVVKANLPVALGKLPESAPANRLGLAQWLVSRQNPLTARVTINRLWQEIFGQGIVKSSEDFGILGSLPSNQELLDWLALDFVDHGWDIKRALKQILMSAAYRQSLEIGELKLNKDRDNSLISRGPRFRMDAEVLRDYALASAGLLSAKMGGPGTRPYQPEGIWDTVGFKNGDTRIYVEDKGENLYRRTLYNFWKRMSPSPNMEIFNATAREVTCVRRERTNTPLQALVTLNDVQFVEASRVLAQRAFEQAGKNLDSKLEYLFKRLLTRAPNEKEKSLVKNTYENALKEYQQQPSEAKALVEMGDYKVDQRLNVAELAALTLVANQIFNMDESLNK